MKIGIIGAMDIEIKKFIELFDLKLVEENIFVGKYNDNDLIICLSGIGKVNSAATTQRLIDKYNVDLIINTGCAGSLSDDIKLFDVVIASNVIYHDFSPLRIMKLATPNNGKIIANNNLINLVKDVIKNHDVKIGTIASGDCFVTDNNTKLDIYKRTNAIAVDMESASIGHISAKNNIPFLIVRTISDFADGEIEFEKEASEISCNIVKYIVNNINKSLI